MKIDLSSLFDAVIERCESQDDFDDALAAECEERYPDQGAEVCEAVRRFIDRRAQGGSRYEVAEKLRHGEASLEYKSFETSSLEDLPPELRAKVEERLASGESGHVREEVTRVTSTEGGPRLDADAFAREHFPAPRPPAGIPGRFWAIVAIFGVLFLLLLLAPLLWGWFGPEAPEGDPTQPARIEPALQRMEERHADEPEDLDTTMRLAEMYARKLLAAKMIAGLRTHRPNPDRIGEEEKGFLDQWDTTLERLSAAAGEVPTEAEMLRIAATGEEAARAALAHPSIGTPQRLAANLLLGHFLLYQGRDTDAVAAAVRAAEINKADPRPHFLYGRIREFRNQTGRANEEYEIAAGKMSAWLSGDPRMTEAVRWGFGSPMSGLMTEETDPKTRHDALRLDVAEGVRIHRLILWGAQHSGAR